MDDFRNRLGEFEELIVGLEALPDPGQRELLREIVGLLLDLHEEALERLLGRISQEGELGRSLIDEFGRDKVVGGLLLLHGLHPRSLESRVAEALEKVRPLLASHGGNVEFVSLKEGVLTLRLDGSCHGCPSSAETLRSTIRDAVREAAPDVVDIVLEGFPRPVPEGIR